MKRCQHPGCEQDFAGHDDRRLYCTEHGTQKWMSWRYAQIRKAKGYTRRGPRIRPEAEIRADLAAMLRPAIMRLDRMASADRRQAQGRTT